MNLPEFPIWLSIFLLAIAVGLIVAYLFLAGRVKTERCTQCGATNPIENSKCEKCGASTFLVRRDSLALLGTFGMLLGFAPLILLLLSAQNYPDPPIPELIASGIGMLVFIFGLVVLVVVPMRRMKLKQRATIHHTSFYGGFCAKCGTEMLGGWAKCPKCGWKVNADEPNWAIVSKNGKTGLPLVDPKIVCYKCKAENEPNAFKCHKCHVDLLAYKPVWLRVGYFVACVLVSLVTGWLAFRAYSDPDLQEGLSLIGFGAISLTLITIVMPFYGLYLAFSGGKLPELLSERASRHLNIQPWQALEDFGHALELAPIQEHAQIMTKRMNLYQSLGLMQNATREELAITYARERNPQGGMGLFIAGNMFGDSFSKGYLSGISKQARKDREKMYAEGRAVIVGYCPVCKKAVELNNEFKCPNSEKIGALKHSGKPKFLQYVIPADLETGKAAVLKAMEVGNKALRYRLVTIALLIILAIGLCTLFNYLAST